MGLAETSSHHISAEFQLLIPSWCGATTSNRGVFRKGAGPAPRCWIHAPGVGGGGADDGKSNGVRNCLTDFSDTGVPSDCDNRSGSALSRYVATGRHGFFLLWSFAWVLAATC